MQQVHLTTAVMDTYNTIKALFEVELDKRDESWEKPFFAALPGTKCHLLSDTPIVGPDGMPYLAVQITEDGEPMDKVLEWPCM